MERYLWSWESWCNLQIYHWMRKCLEDIDIWDLSTIWWKRIIFTGRLLLNLLTAFYFRIISFK